MRDYGKVYTAFWTDSSGIERKVPAGKKLHFCRLPLHAALRAFIYVRDNFTCKWCGTTPEVFPANYDGREGVFVIRKAKSGYQSSLVIDHVLSRRNGGTNHPSNLQTLCDCCNAAKSGLVDSKVGR